MLFERSRFKTPGCAIRFTAPMEGWDEELYPDRGTGLSLNRATLAAKDPRLKQLLGKDLVLTCSPNYRAVLVYAESYWDEIQRPQLEQLPNGDPECRRMQRLMLGHATPVVQSDPLIVPTTLIHFAALTGDDVLVVFDPEYAEIWGTAQLGEISSNR